jgi:molybdate transport system regulatory protein
MSYRRAWMLIDELNRQFGEPVVRAQPGGAKGGGATVTSAGQRILTAYRAAERKMREAAASEIAALEALLAP